MDDNLNISDMVVSGGKNAKDRTHRKAIRRITLWGLAVNIGLTIAKFIVGYLAKSQACIADAVHSCSDFLTDIAVLVGIRFWTAPADSDHPHGHQRIEALITMFIGVLLGASAVSMIVKAVKTIGEQPDSAASAWPLLGVALASILCKEILYQCTVMVGHACGSSAVIANAWHHRSDAISSIPVAVVAVAARIWPEITYLDHIAAVIVACLLLHTAWSIAWPCIKELSDQGVSLRELEAIRKIAAGISGVKEVHKLRSRRFGNGILLDMHILVDKNMSVDNGHRICEEATTEIKRKMPIVLDVLTHLEPDESVNLPSEIEKVARGVEGVQGVQSIAVRNLTQEIEVECTILVVPTMTVADGAIIGTRVRDSLLAAHLKIKKAVVHVEPWGR
ncbi:MAG: cation transporter [Victivallales bacterium]|nr:cation transporter [Victivallales bacterium]